VYLLSTKNCKYCNIKLRVFPSKLKCFDDNSNIKNSCRKTFCYCIFRRKCWLIFCWRCNIHFELMYYDRYCERNCSLKRQTFFFDHKMCNDDVQTFNIYILCRKVICIQRWRFEFNLIKSKIFYKERCGKEFESFNTKNYKNTGLVLKIKY
jgi:hypothetical protein